MMRVGSLFSGIGGADLALESLGCETVWHSDVEPYAEAVFARRFPGSLPLGDIRGIGPDAPAVDILVGGFPCQDISAAGRGAGIAEGTRSGLWGEYARLVRQLRPRLVLIENVSALLRRGLDRVLWDLFEAGYAAEWDCIPAAAVGAPHLRDRIWIVAYPEDIGPLHVFGEAHLEKSLATLQLPPSKWPRAGRMEQGAVYVSEPVAPRKTKRLSPGSAWAGVRLDGGFSPSPLWPTPAACVPNLGEGVETWEARRARTKERVGNGNGFGTPLSIAVQKPELIGLWPTPEASDGSGGRVASEVGGLRPSGSKRAVTLATKVAHVERGLWPTPTTQDAANNGGAAQFRRNSPPLNAAVGGALNPAWVEWLMGFPVGWTDLACEAPQAAPFDTEPDVSRVAPGVERRPARLKALGNALVPQVMRWVAGRSLDRLP